MFDNFTVELFDKLLKHNCKNYIQSYDEFIMRVVYVLSEFYPNEYYINEKFVETLDKIYQNLISDEQEAS